MKGVLGYLKGFVGGALFLITLLLVVVGIGIGSAAIGGVPKEAGLGEKAMMAIIVAVAIVAGGACYWAAARMFRASEARPLDLRCFLGGYPLLAAGIISIGVSVLFFFNSRLPALTGAPPLALGLCWLWVAVTLFRGNSTPVDNWWSYLIGQLWLASSMLLAFVAYNNYWGNEGWEIYLAMFFSLNAFVNGVCRLRFGKPLFDSSEEGRPKGGGWAQAAARPPGELSGFLTALVLVAAGAMFLAYANHLSVDNCMREITKNGSFSSDERAQLRSDLAKGQKGEFHEHFFGLSDEACTEMRNAGIAKSQENRRRVDEKLESEQ